MAIFLPDTNVLVDAFNDKRGRKELLSGLVIEGHRLACCAVTIAEIYSGMRSHEARATEQFLSTLQWYETSPSVARLAGRLRFDWAREGVTLALPDTLIAAVALEHNLTLITGNRKHFPMPDLRLHPLP